MSVSQFRIGSYVTHANKPEWGMGKVLCSSAPYVLVAFEHLPPPDQFKRLVALPGMLMPAVAKSNPVLGPGLVRPGANRCGRCGRVRGLAPPQLKQACPAPEGRCAPRPFAPHRSGSRCCGTYAIGISKARRGA
jgi:hypothetical protein